MGPVAKHSTCGIALNQVRKITFHPPSAPFLPEKSPKPDETKGQKNATGGKNRELEKPRNWCRGKPEAGDCDNHEAQTVAQLTGSSLCAPVRHDILRRHHLRPLLVSRLASLHWKGLTLIRG